MYINRSFLILIKMVATDSKKGTLTCNHTQEGQAALKRSTEFCLSLHTGICRKLTISLATKGHNLNKLVRGPLGDAINQISRL